MTGQSSTALARRETLALTRPSIPSNDEINRQWRMAEALAKSGAFPDARTAGMAYAKMLIGHDLGLSPTQALMGIYIVEGKPLVGSTLLASFVKRIPGYDYRIVEHDDEHCVIRFFVDGKACKPDSVFTIEDARRAGLVKEKSGWTKYPRAMLFARALSQGVRLHMPDATGGVPVYVEGEIEPRPDLTAGLENGEARGIDLHPKVEKVLARAVALGHVGLADRATAEMVLAQRAPEVSVEWAQRAEAELDTFEQAQAEPEIADAEVVEAVEATPAEEELAERIHQDRVEALEEALAGELSEQARSDAEAELDVLTSQPGGDDEGES
jgi:hypothetical protein